MKKKIRVLPPSMREKKRYLLVELLSKKPLKISKKELSKELNDFFLSFFGIFGFSKMDVKLIEWNPNTNELILKSSLHAYENIAAVLQFLKEIQNIKVIPVCKRISGTIKGLKA